MLMNLVLFLFHPIAVPFTPARTTNRASFVSLAAARLVDESRKETIRSSAPMSAPRDFVPIGKATLHIA
jgi:hypothetical protein